MEAMLTTMVENGLVGGGFAYMLYVFMSKFTTTLDKISSSLESMNTRMELMDARLSNLERKDEKEAEG